jgi:hypothetical protein
MLPGARVLRIAVAYVTAGGIDELVETLDEAGMPATVQVVTRATHTTATRADLKALEARLRAEVKAFVGVDARAFHPKCLLTLTDTAMWILSGSGNLTRGGLTTNREQFELLQLPSGPRRPQLEKFETQAGLDLTRRWDDYWKYALPLSSALASPAYVAWEQQAERRADLVAQMREIEGEAEAQGAGTGGAPIQAELEHSRTATDQKVRARMDSWFPSARVREQVYELLAHAMNVANSLNPDGWYAGYVTDSRWGGNRLSVNARNAQAFLAHSDGEVYFPAPPEEIDAVAFKRAMAMTSIPGVRIQASKIGELDDGREHPYVLVPASALPAALDAGARDLIDATMQWRMVQGLAPFWRVHSPALVRVVGHETGQRIAQPGYED